MLVLSRGPGERILVEPDSRAQLLANLLREVERKVGEHHAPLAEAIVLAEAMASERMTITALKVVGRRMKLGVDAATERKVVREEIGGELKVPA